MSFPQYPSQYPSQDPYGQPGGAGARDQPGLIPLRPQRVGEMLGVAFAVLRRHLLPLGGAAVGIALLSSVVLLGLVSANDALQTYADAQWVNDLLAGGSIPGAILLSSVASLLVSTIGAPIIAGMAVAYTGAQALGRDGRGAVTERLAGRWPVLLGVCVVFGVAVSVGLMLLVVPGVVAYLIWLLAAPAVVMEKASFGEAFRRSAQLTRGHRGRIAGAVIIAMLIGSVASTVVASMAGALFASSSAVTSLVVTQLVSSVVSGLGAAWTGAVVAVVYIEIRIRNENLDQALRRAAAANPPT
ncbi:MAG: hypothetical protein ABWZ02_09035, partial [Nakamurella sp.]